MHILHICDSINPDGLGGYESYLHYLSRMFSRNGHESFVVTQTPSRDTDGIAKQEYYERIDLPGNYLEARKWEFLSAPVEQREHLVRDLFAKDDLERNIELLADQLEKVLIEKFPDIIHAHSTYIVFNRVLEILAEREIIQKTPLVATVHGLPKPLILPDGTNTIDFDQLALHNPFDCILGVSEAVAKMLRESLTPSGRDGIVKRFYIGIDIETFRPNPSIVKQWDLAFLGRFELMKSVDLFPEMLEKLQGRFPHLKMVMTGEGSIREKVLTDLEERGISHMVDYLGVVETSKISGILNKSRIFLYPSREEPFGLSIIEAMACSVPVITTNVFGPLEIISHGYDGYLISPGNLQELVQAVEMLLGDDALYDRIRVHSRETVQSRFDMKEQAMKLMVIYQELISRKSLT